MGVGRLDDLVTGRSLLLGAPLLVLRARRPEEVPAVLDRVEAEARAGRWCVGMVAYEAAAGLDPSLPVLLPGDQPGHHGLPLAWFAVLDPGQVCEGEVPGTPVPEDRSAVEWRLDWDRASHAEGVRLVREAIARGDSYQSNLTTTARRTLDRSAGGFRDQAHAQYLRLAARQQGAWCALLDVDDHCVASASPEQFFTWHDGLITCRPMKGTSRRSTDPVQDARLRDELVASAKQQAENVMIVDLLRNDLARVCTEGSVLVTELLTAEQYPTVWQLTSTVQGRTGPGASLLDVFRALFPCGSITGAPKLSTMELLCALEDGPRGAYCGAVGVVHPQGDGIGAAFNVAIRTVVTDCTTGEQEYGVGGGITWSSRADEEYDELLAKAAIL